MVKNTRLVKKLIKKKAIPSRLTSNSWPKHGQCSQEHLVKSIIKLLGYIWGKCKAKYGGVNYWLSVLDYNIFYLIIHPLLISIYIAKISQMQQTIKIISLLTWMPNQILDIQTSHQTKLLNRNALNGKTMKLKEI